MKKSFQQITIDVLKNKIIRNEKNVPLKPPSFFMPNQASFAWKANSADSNDKKQYYPIKS